MDLWCCYNGSAREIASVAALALDLAVVVVGIFLSVVESLKC